MRVAVLSVEDAQHPGAQHVNNLGGVGAGVVHGAALQPVLKQAAGLQELGKEGQLAHGGGFAFAAPLNFKYPAWRLNFGALIENPRALPDGFLAGLNGLALCKIRFTHLVSPQVTLQPACSLRSGHFA